MAVFIQSVEPQRAQRGDIWLDYESDGSPRARLCVQSPPRWYRMVLAPLDGGLVTKFARHDGLWAAASIIGENKTLYQNATTVGNDANTNEKDLHVFTMPGGTLAADNDAVMIYAMVRNANNANNKQTKLIFGATEIGTSTIVAASNNWWIVQALVIRTGAATQKAVCWVSNVANAAAWNSAAGGNGLETAPTETLSGNVVIKVTGHSPTAGVANDVQAILTTILKVSAAA